MSIADLTFKSRWEGAPPLPLAFLGALASDIGCGAASQRRLRDIYAPPINETLQDLERRCSDDQALSLSMARIRRFSTCGQKKTGTIMSSIDLRAAAEAVYRSFADGISLVERLELIELKGTLLVENTLPEHIPRSKDVKSSFQRFDAELRRILTCEAQKISQTGWENKFEGSDLDRNPNYLRAVVIQFTLKALKKIGNHATRDHRKDLAFLGQVLDWLTTLPLTFSHDFFQMLLRDPWVKAKGGMGFFNQCVNAVNAGRSAAYCVSTEYIRKDGKAGRSLYKVEHLTVNRGLVKRVSKRIPNVDLLDLIIRSSQEPKYRFYSKEGLPACAAEALITLNPLQAKTLTAEDRNQRLAAIGSILSLFLRPYPILMPHTFFRGRLTHRGLDYQEQQRLVQAVNEACGTRYSLFFRKYIGVEWLPE